MIYQGQINIDIDCTDIYVDEDEFNHRVCFRIFLFICVMIYDPIGQISLVLSSLLEQEYLQTKIESFEALNYCFPNKQYSDVNDLNDVNFLHTTNSIIPLNQGDKITFKDSLNFFLTLEAREEKETYASINNMYNNISVSDNHYFEITKYDRLHHFNKSRVKKIFIEDRQFDYNRLLALFNR